MKNNISKSKRIASIDVFRALTMVLMIFVNDLWTNINSPQWLKHAPIFSDSMGLADVVFPAFLFILGMSVPLAIESRIKVGDTNVKMIIHIIFRTIALLILGVFTVNYDVSPDYFLKREVFIMLSIVGAFMVWNVYPKTESRVRNIIYKAIKYAGIGLLVFLAFTFINKDGERFQTHWWGILGLIGWSYLYCAIAYLSLRNHKQLLPLVALFFIGLCMLGSSQMLGPFSGVIVGNGCFPAFGMLGMMTMLLYCQSEEKISTSRKMSISTVSGVFFIGLAFLCRNFWILDKEAATPTWLFMCTGISLLAYTFIYWLCDVRGKANWFILIKPAGTATLTCYLIPFFVHAIYSGYTGTNFGILTPEMITGIFGVIKSIIFALLTVGAAALLGKIGIKLKL